jgi:hypothetical protein
MGPINTDLVIFKYKNHFFPKFFLNHPAQYLKYKIGLLIHFTNYLAHNIHSINISMLFLPQNPGHHLIPFE